jgi:predicted phage terminase large subunit-like protein
MLSKAEFAVYVLENKYIKEVPTLRQAEFLLHDELEGGFGGQAGPGKTSALLMSSLMYVHEPSYAAILFRKTYRDLSLPGSLMDRSHLWLRNTDAKWDGMDKRWVFPSGARLQFGYLDASGDHFRYQSAEFSFIGIDEATQIPEIQFLYMFSRLRRNKDNMNIPLRFRIATNPGNISHTFIKDRFVTPTREELLKENRFWLPASLKDNPHVDQTSYLEALSKLDPITRAQLQDGNWDAEFVGGMFKREWFTIVNDYPHDANIIRAWDLAATEKTGNNDPDWTAGVLLAEYDGIYYVIDVKHVRATPGSVEALIRQTAELDPPQTTIWMEQEPGSAGVSNIDHYARNVLKGFPFRGIKPTGPKQTRAMPVSAAASNGNIRIVKGQWNNEFLNELVLFPTKDIHDDIVDSLSLAFSMINRPQGVRAISLK